MTDEDPKIIVDDDWKSQVEQEKEQLAQESSEPTSDGGGEIPPASFPMLVNTLCTQAFAALGVIPDATGKPNVNREMAKHFIDTLGVLEEKTKGNLTPDEAAMMTNMLHQLRMAFVSVPDSPPTGESDDPPASSTIELP